MATTTTTLKLPEALKTRISRIAKKSGRSAHSFMIDAIEKHATREERMEAFAREALAADRAIEEGGEVFAAEDVHVWLERIAAGGRRTKPKPCRE